MTWEIMEKKLIVIDLDNPKVDSEMQRYLQTRKMRILIVEDVKEFDKVYKTKVTKVKFGDLVKTCLGTILEKSKLSLR
jgi:hypothetical protein